MALAHQSFVEHDAPAAFFAEHLNSALGKWPAAQLRHLPFEASHSTHSEAYALDRQHWPPLQMALTHQSLVEQDAPAERLFSAKHLNSSLRKYEASQMLHLPVKAHFEHPEA